MYDGLQSPGRNDECWCGSGKKYKKCHLDFDERLEELAETGEEVPPRDLLKTPAEIEGIKRSAEVNVGVLDYVAERITPGITTEQIDQWVHDYTVEHGAIPAPLDYEGFPKSVCTSVNEVVCHGIPSPDEVLREGDIVNIDCSTIKDGFFSDSSRMFCIGEVSPEAADLVRVTKEAVQGMILALQNQTDQFGEATIIRPAIIIVPSGYMFDMYTLFYSPTISTSGNTQAVNPLYRYKDSITVVEDPTINALCGGFGNVMPWWLLGAKDDTDFIEVDYLNGQEIPTIRRMETPGTLGFVWDIYLDWGISVMDYRGAIKNPGIEVKNPIELA